MSLSTRHGDNIARNIAGEDVFGDSGTLTPQDVYNIIDQMHTNQCNGDDQGEGELGVFLASLLDQLISKFGVEP